MAYPNNVQTKNTIYENINYVQKLFYAKAGTNNFYNYIPNHHFKTFGNKDTT